MISRYRIAMDGIELDSLDDNLRILNIEYSPLEKADTEYETANLDGFDTVGEKYRGQRVTVTFELHIYGVKARNAACQKVNKWANVHGKLTVNEREGQYLQAKCQQFAAVNARDWTEPLTLVFVSERIPFWQSVTPKTVTITGTNSRGTLQMDGNVSKCLVECEITAQANITSLRLIAGSAEIKLSKLTLPVNTKLKVTYTNDRIIKITANGKSALENVDASSADNLTAVCGGNTTVGFVANGKVTGKFTGKGRWL